MKLYVNLILKKLPLFCIILLAFSKASMALIIRTDNLSFIEKEITTRKDTLVIFDVDEVLIVGKDQARHPYYQDFIVSECLKITNAYHEEEAFRLFSIMWEQGKAELVNPAVAPLIQHLSKKNIKVIALTNAWTGKFGNIENIEEWRVKELKNLGIDFSSSFPKLNPMIFDSLTPIVKNRFASFSEGVLFSCNIEKGVVLDAFLKIADYIPQRIIFIDDKFNNLESVEQFAYKNGIEFIGFEYRAVKNRVMPPLNVKRAKLQFELLKKQNIWLSDTEADKKLLLYK